MTKKLFTPILRHCLIFGTIMLLSITYAQAQWSVGVTAGYSHNTLDINPGYAYDMRYRPVDGFTVAIPVQYRFQDWFALRAEVGYIQKGYRMERTNAYTGIYSEQRNDYVQLPVLASFSFGGKRLRGFFNAGGYVGYWVSNRVKSANMNLLGVNHDPNNTVNSILDPSNTEHTTNNSAFDSKRDNRFEVGLVAGTGLSYRVSNMVELQIEGRYYYSLTDIQKQYMKFLSPRYNNTVTLQVGCMITFGSTK